MKKLLLILLCLPLLFSCNRLLDPNICKSNCEVQCTADVCRNIEGLSIFTNQSIESIIDCNSDYISIGAPYLRISNLDDVTDQIITRNYSSVRVLKSSFVSRKFDVDTTLKYLINLDNDIIRRIKYSNTEYCSGELSSFFQHNYTILADTIDISKYDENLIITNFIPKSGGSLTQYESKNQDEKILNRGFISVNNIEYTEDPKIFHFQNREKDLKYSFLSLYNGDNHYTKSNMGYFLEHKKSSIITLYNFNSYIFSVKSLNFLINENPVFLVKIGYNYSDGAWSSILYHNGREYTLM
jgi:hypothetical protein